MIVYMTEHGPYTTFRRWLVPQHTTAAVERAAGPAVVTMTTHHRALKNCLLLVS